MVNFQATGVAMMLRAMGFDPQMVAEKGAELEAFARGFAEATKQQMHVYDARLDRIETMLTLLVAKTEAQHGAILPAGDNEVSNAVVLMPKEAQNGRHSTRDRGANRATRSKGGH